MYCPKCGKQNKDDAQFCVYCGAELISNTGGKIDKEAAKEMVKEIVKDSINNIINKKTPKKIKNSWDNFYLSEKAIVIGAIVVFVSFFLPWSTSKYISGIINGISVAEMSKWVYIIPFLAIVSLVLVFLKHQTNNVSKFLGARWQIVIGTFFVTIETLGIMLNGEFGDTGIGLWLMLLGSLAILIGGLKLQSKLLKI